MKRSEYYYISGLLLFILFHQIKAPEAYPLLIFAVIDSTVGVYLRIKEWWK